MQAHESAIPPYELPITIKPTDIDELGHVNNVVYLSWVQDVAIAHWAFLATLAHRNKCVWVALRHEIDYKAEAVLGDTVIAKTWTGTARGVRFQRHTEIIHIDELGVRKILATAVTQWCPLDRSTGRPTRLPTEIAAFFSQQKKD